MIRQIPSRTDESFDRDIDADLAALLDLWPDEPEPDPRETSLWRGALTIAVTGVATIVLLSAAVLQTAYHAALLLWIWFGLPLVLAVAAAVRISTGRLRPAHRRRDTARAGTSGTRATSGD